MDHEKRILLVDDDIIILDLYAQALDMSNIKYDCAEEGSQALELIKCHKYSQIITDINMPNGMGGFGLLEELKKQPDLVKDTEIFVVSGFIKNKINILSNYDVKKYIDKPLTIQNFLDLV